MSEATPFDFEIVSAVVSANRMSFVVDLARVISEINIFEHVDKPFLTGNILFNDNAGLYNEVNWQGTETLSLTIRTDQSGDFTINRVFRIINVKQSVKSNDNNETFLMEFIDEYAWLSSTINVNKAYQGKCKNIVTNIISDNLGIEVMSQNKPDSYKDMRVLVPNMSPLQAAMWIKDRARDVYGSPYFLYASIADERLRYIDLETILSLGPLNSGRDYIFAQAFGSQSPKMDFEDQCFIIQTYRQPESENMLRLSNQGYVGAEWEFLDPIKANSYKIKHDISSTFRSMVARGVFPSTQNVPVYDGAEALHKNTSRHITQMAGSRTYTDYKKVNNIYEAEEATYHREKILSKALRNFLLKSPVDINVPGKNFFLRRKNMTIGNTINVMFQVNDDTDGSNVVDYKRSGQYMVYSARHVFTANRYTVNLTCAKLATGSKRGV